MHFLSKIIDSLASKIQRNTTDRMLKQASNSVEAKRRNKFNKKMKGLSDENKELDEIIKKYSK